MAIRAGYGLHPRSDIADRGIGFCPCGRGAGIGAYFYLIVGFKAVKEILMQDSPVGSEVAAYEGLPDKTGRSTGFVDKGKVGKGSGTLCDANDLSVIYC